MGTPALHLACDSGGGSAGKYPHLKEGLLPDVGRAVPLSFLGREGGPSGGREKKGLVTKRREKHFGGGGGGFFLFQGGRELSEKDEALEKGGRGFRSTAT